jgi:RNA polymerase sigma factor (sigma-70 family)
VFDIRQPGVALRAEEKLARQQALEIARQVLQKLSFEQREAFILYELEGLEGQEIAELVAIPLGTVWTRLQAARKRFTRLMRQRLPEVPAL